MPTILIVGVYRTYDDECRSLIKTRQTIQVNEKYSAANKTERNINLQFNTFTMIFTRIYIMYDS